MRIIYIAAGAAGSYCGACSRDVTLARELIAQGHDVQMIPLYTPIQADGPDPSVRQVFYGGINAYLQQHSAICRRLPPVAHWLLDRPFLLRIAGRFAVHTRPEKLGPMTVSVLQGAAGRQRRELEELLGYLAHGHLPDVVNLTNSLLSGLAPALRERLHVPVICTLQGEESFVERLREPHREHAWDLLRQNAAAVDAFIAPGRQYAEDMARLLNVPAERVHVVHAGIDMAQYARRRAMPPGQPFRIGFLSRLSRDKGLDTLCRAFRLLAEGRPTDHELVLAGQCAGPGAKLWGQLSVELDAAGLADRVRYIGVPDLRGKIAMLSGCHVFCVPERFPEPRGMACLEAMALGLPAVGPDLGIFPEVAELTGGLVCVPPDDPRALAAALAELRDDPGRIARMGQAAAKGIAEHFSAAGMAAGTLNVYRQLT